MQSQAGNFLVCINDLTRLSLHFFLILPMTITLMLWDFSLLGSDPLGCLIAQM